MTLHVLTTSLRAETAARSHLNSKVAICRQPSQLISLIEIHCQLIGADQVGMVMIRRTLCASSASGSTSGGSSLL